VTTYCRLYYRIPFSETDAMAIVHHSNHARYLERGRIELLRLVGLDYASLMKRGMQYPVLEVRTVFKKPLVFDEVILIETVIGRATRTRLDFQYKIFSTPEWRQPALATEPYPGAPSVLGETFHCCVNEKGRPVEAAPDVVARLLELQGGPARPGGNA
jgi:acyl-CoA thioester hydrolase